MSGKRRKTGYSAAKKRRGTESGRRSREKRASRKRWAFLIASFVLLALIVGVLIAHEPVLRSVFPLKYGAEVAKSAADYGLDRWLVYAVIKVESDFVPDAVSHAGAVGLMQLMPDTAEWIAWRRGDQAELSKLTMPSYNVDMGCCLLAYLLDYYDGNLDYAIAAYNAGKARVDEWLEDPEYFDGESLSIPYPETKAYVAKVKYAYEKYTELYS